MSRAFSKRWFFTQWGGHADRGVWRLLDLPAVIAIEHGFHALAVKPASRSRIAAQASVPERRAQRTDGAMVVRFTESRIVRQRTLTVGRPGDVPAAHRPASDCAQSPDMTRLLAHIRPFIHAHVVDYVALGKRVVIHGATPTAAECEVEQ